MKMRIGDRDLAYASYGRGKPLALVHAFPFDSRMWHETALALADRCQVIVPDMRGFGESDLGPGEPSIADMADDLAVLLDHLGLQRATVGGLSMGGYVSLAFAARHPLRLEGLVLADTRAAADSETARAGRAEALERVPREGVEAYVERQLPMLLSSAASDALRERVRVLGKQTVDGVCAGLKALRDRPDRQLALADVRCPTLVIVGTHDKISTPEEMGKMAAAIPGSRLVEIPDAGHLSNLENPTAFVRAVANFM